MSKGGGGGSPQTVNTQVEPPAYAKEFLEFGLNEAKDQYQSSMPNFYPDSTVIGFSPENEMALQGIRNRALDPNSMTAQMQGVVQQNLMGTNPLAMAAFKPVIDSVQSQFAKAGRYGSGANQQALASALAPAALQAQQAAITQTPQVQNMDLAQLGQVGAAREGQAQAELQSNMDRFNFEQNIGAQKLKDYLALVGGGTVGSNTSNPVFRNQAASGLGGALGGAQLGSSLGFNPMLGAVGGGLLGMM
tara:strand:+ start:23 stop:763 length:741 start_codon:yes stop_codon:yes gene_type:complete